MNTYLFINATIGFSENLFLVFSSPVGSLCHTHGIVRRMACVLFAHHNCQKNKDIKSVFGANVHHVPGLCLLGIGGAPTLAIKLWLKNHSFTFLTSSLKPPADGTSYYTRRFSKSRTI